VYFVKIKSPSSETVRPRSTARGAHGRRRTEHVQHAVLAASDTSTATHHFVCSGWRALDSDIANVRAAHRHQRFRPGTARRCRWLAVSSVHADAYRHARRFRYASATRGGMRGGFGSPSARLGSPSSHPGNADNGGVTRPIAAGDGNPRRFRIAHRAS
jgi:hypothetical protein